MEDIISCGKKNGIRFVWNTLPCCKLEAAKIYIPIGFHYNIIIKNENLPLLEYELLKCRCVSKIFHVFNYSAKSKF